MSPPSRREFLVALGTTGAGVAAGCLSAPDAAGPGTTPPRTPDTAATPDTEPDSATTPRRPPIEVDLRNGFDSPVRVRVTVTGGSGRVSEQVAEVPAGDRITLDSGIDAVGEYTVAVDVTDGPADEATVEVDDYDIDNGSDIIVSVGSEGVEFLVQE